MDWNLIGAILSSSIVAAFLTKALDMYSANINYKRDYYKKVIEERLNVYNQLNDVLYLTASDHINSNGKVLNAVFYDAETLFKFFVDLDKINRQRLWMSEELGALQKTFLEKIDKVVDENKLSLNSSNDLIKEAGVVFYNEFTYYCQCVEHQISIDLSNLHNVPVFFKKQIQHAKPTIEQ